MTFLALPVRWGGLFGLPWLLLAGFAALMTVSPAEAQRPPAWRDNAESIAVIIANKTYKYTVEVPFALNDGAAMRQFLIQRLGYRAENIQIINNAVQRDMLRLFGNGRGQKGTLYYAVAPGESNVFVYYSGHGIPDPSGRGAFLLPTDGDPDFPTTAYGLNTLERSLQEIGVKLGDKRSVMLMMDACFTGNSAYGAVLKNARGGLVPNLGKPLVTRLSAGAAGHLAHPDKKRKMGLFTDRFLRAVAGAADRNRDKQVTWAEIERFVRIRVPRHAGLTYGRPQVPQLPAANALPWQFAVVDEAAQRRAAAAKGGCCGFEAQGGSRAQTGGG